MEKARMAATQSRNILLVEDDTDFRQTLAQRLRLHEEFEVEEAGTGEAAILGAEKTNYNTILLDVNLPDMDGREEQLHGQRQGPGIRRPALPDGKV
jgi:DNA-binding response OmpR family regulator